MKSYDPRKIEKKWQKYWEKERIYKNYKRLKKFYALDMFPYISGTGLHVGHPRGYIATDIISRYKMMQGYSVLHPMGWDAFGLPTENYAIKNKIHPKVAVNKDIKRFKKQLNMFGFTYDWDKEINTTDPEYYKWTQWIFLQLFKKGLAYESYEPINWCPVCQTGLANEDLENGRCERCGSEIEKKPMRQWVLKMTAYADRLLEDLKLLDWDESIIEQQRNWIGRSEGDVISFKIKSQKSNLKNIDVFTTRVDTIFGCTYCVVAPEHNIISNFKEVEKYIKQAKKKSDLQRTDLAKEIIGVELKGIKAINPFNNEEVPIFVADYVLATYGTGAVMAVPAHDERDFEFAKKYNLPIRKVILPKPLLSIVRNAEDIAVGAKSSLRIEVECFTDDGDLVNSGQFTNLTSEKARKEMTKWLEKNNLGGRKINYKMRDWVFSRQRYWGEPIPIIHCKKCGVVPVPEKDLPVKLPDVKNYKPTGTGESPLVNIKKWVNTKCPKCNGQAKRETNTMPQWAGSSWYYLAYLMLKNQKYKLNKKEFKKWMPVDLYVGGVEHATRHLLYARFWHKFLYDIGVVSTKEPFKKLVNQGLILAEDGRKMSKRWKNVINPDDVIRVYGADSIRLYEMFMGPFNQSIAWSINGIKGMRRFLDRVYNLKSQIFHPPKFCKAKFVAGKNLESASKKSKYENLLHKTIKKVTEDIEGFKFNTAISALMILTNEMEKEKRLRVTDYALLVTLLSPFAPHIAEELWNQLSHASAKATAGKSKKSIFLEKWPKYDPKKIKEETFQLVVQINGKVRDTFEASMGISEKDAKILTLGKENVKKWINNKLIKKTVFVPNKLINIVI